MKIKQLPLIIVTILSLTFAACGGSFGYNNMSIIGTLPVQLANNTLADATQVMSDLNYIVNQVNANAAGLANNNNFTGTQTISGDAVVTATATQTLTNKTLTSPTINGLSGNYTPTITSGANCTVPFAFVSQWMQVGTVVTVSGILSITPTTGAALTTAYISLPVASNFVSSAYLSGTSSRTTPSAAWFSGSVSGDATNHRAQLNFWSTEAGSSIAVSYIFTYTVV